MRILKSSLISQIYEDSIKLGTVFTYARETLEKTGQLPAASGRSDVASGDDDDGAESLKQNEASGDEIDERMWI